MPRICSSAVTLLLFVQFTTSCAVYNESVNLTFMLVTSFGGVGRYNSSGTLPAADIALREINNRSDILPRYILQYDKVRDSECIRQTSLNVFFDGMMSDPMKIGVIGCGCSVASEPVAEIIHHWNIPLIAYGTTSATLSNIEVYKNFFRANPPSTTLTPALVALMKQFQWRKVGLLTQDENRFQRVEDSIRTNLEPIGIDVASRHYPTGADPNEISDFFLEREDFRVFVLNSYPNPRVICEIFRRGFLHPNYTWIIYGWYAQAFWTNEDVVNCTYDQLSLVLENAISVEVFPIPEDTDVMTVANLTPKEFQDTYQERARIGGYEVLDTTAAQLHDDVWGLALALNVTMAMVEANNTSGTGCDNKTGDLVPLEEFTYDNEMMGCLITWSLRNINFSGVSGHVHFDEELIDHTATLLKYELKDGDLTRRRFATVDRATNFTFEYEDGFTENNLFPGGIPPDGKPQILIHTVLLPMAVMIDILAFFGIVFAVVCLLFNTIFKETKVVKLTSPNLNYFIIFGTIVMYMSIFFYLIPTTMSIVAQASCLVREWLFTIGYTLAYGALLSKLWRVYKIFHNPAPNKMIFKDWHLMIFTLVVTGFAVILLILGTSIPQLRGAASETRDLECPAGRTDQGVRIEYNVLVCYQDVGAPLYWRIFIFSYLAVLQILGIMLAFQTRRVKVKGLKDSTFVAANVYISSIVIVIFILITFLLRSYLNVYCGMFSVGIFILTTTFLSLTFVPKMITLYKDPTGDSLQQPMTATNNHSGPDVRPQCMVIKNNQDSAGLMEKVAVLEKKLTESEQTMEHMKTEMEKLQNYCRNEDIKSEP